MEKKFIRVRSTKDIIIFSSLIVLGAILALLFEAEAANLGGWTLIVAGVVVAFVMKSAYRDVDTKKMYHKKELLFSGDMKSKLLSALASNPQSIGSVNEGSSQAIMLRIYYSKPSAMAHLQLLEYIPYQYEPCSEMYDCELSKIEHLLK